MRRRYPAQALADAMGLTLWQMFDRLGVSGSTATDARDRGLTELMADRLATRADMSAYVVWPEMLDDAIADQHRVCAAEGCEESFLVDDPRRIYCSTRCRDRRAKAAWRRNRYRSDPEYREQVKAASKARYERERDYIRRQQNARRSRSVA